ncbi:MAG: hypothetical protein P4L53_14895 [Candidatus Obscuribacterales bacterium]|nr:hypothetical protein [Candidatus Obscuribacterales bacterium]
MEFNRILNASVFKRALYKAEKRSSFSPTQNLSRFIHANLEIHLIQP